MYWIHMLMIMITHDDKNALDTYDDEDDDDMMIISNTLHVIHLFADHERTGRESQSDVAGARVSLLGCALRQAGGR
jgi:hypothetical protein